jgi:hypothetical protein
MPSHQHFIPVSPCVVQPNASIPSTCSTRDPIALDMSARLASVRIPSPQEGRLAPPRPGGAVVLCRMRMPCHLLCWAWRGILKSCDVLCGMARSCPRMMTCGSPCGYCASLTPSLAPYKFSSSLSLPSCPRLKFISTTLGSILPSPNSHVRVSSPPNPMGDGDVAKRENLIDCLPFCSYLISAISSDSR